MSGSGRSTSRRGRRRCRRAFVTAIVLWVLAIGAITLVDLQRSATSEAVAGREALALGRARWAARAGIEAALARLAFETLEPTQGDALAIGFELEDVARAEFDGASFVVRHSLEKEDRDGPADASAKININSMSKAALMTLSFMTEDVADAILDWVDSDEDPQPLGAEIGSYAGLPHPYEPRNGPFRSLLEVEQVLGVLPEYVRGEDWNLNGVLDPNEDDGDDSFPPDNADGVLDAGWSGIVTCASLLGGLASTGEPRLDLTLAAASDVQRVTAVEPAQAEVIVAYALVPGATLASFIQSSLQQLAQQAGVQVAGRLPALSAEQLAALLSDCSIGEVIPGPGKLNLNTCPDEIFDYLPEIPVGVADAIITDRSGRAAGYISFADLLDVQGLNAASVASLYAVADVRSEAFVVTSRGIDVSTGIEVEMVATLDRSSLPVVIRELLIR